MSFDIIILAAGNGKRMGGNIPKVMCKIGGLPIIYHIFDTISLISYNNVFLVIDDGVKIEKLERNCSIIYQKDKLGTAYATKIVLEHLKEDVTLILYGDSPFITSQILNKMLTKIKTTDSGIILFAFKLQNINDSYGRLVINNDNLVEKIMEYQDIKNLNYSFDLANSGIMAIKTDILKKYIPKIGNNNAQKEYYLTDIVEIARKDNVKVRYIEGLYEEAIGVNTYFDLVNAQYCFQQKLRNNFIKSGVTFIDPNTVYFSYDTKIIGLGVIIHQHVIFGEGVVLEGNVEILQFSVLNNCTIKHGAKIGPFANISKNSVINENAQIGNFVEIKESNISENVKIKHLSYIGNTKIGKDTNIGAGTITCNYDGKLKQKTIIGKNCFIGANTTFISPIKMNDNSKTAAGSVITKDIDENSLAISRSNQINKINKYKIP